MIYTVLNVEDAQQFVGHVCLFGDSVYEIEEFTNFGILASVCTDTTDAHPYAKYGKVADNFYALMAPCPEWDSLLEEVKNYTPLKKRIITEYQHYLGVKGEYKDL